MKGYEVMAITVLAGLGLFIVCCFMAAIDLHVEGWWRRRQWNKLHPEDKI